MHKTLIIWHRYGKEHADNPDELRVNPPEVIAAQLDTRRAHFRATPEADWRWWQVDETLLIERPLADEGSYQADTRIYYLLPQGLAVIENFHFPPPNDDLRWYIHLAEFAFDPARQCWVMKDMFCDILAPADTRAPLVIDLDDLATALDLGLLTPAQASRILRQTEAARRAMRRGEFPFAELERARAAGRALGW